MSKFLTNAAVIDFDSEVKHEYQAMGKLRNTVTTRSNVTGESYKFARMGKGLANQKASQADVTPMDVSYARQTATMENWNAPEYTDIFDQAEVNFDEKSELAKAIAKAITRREDQIIIDVIAAGTYSATPAGDPDVGLTVATTGAGLTVAQLRSASTGLTKRAVESGDRTLILSADSLSSLLGETETTSSDFNTVKALVQGEIDTFLGFKFVVIEDRDEGGLPALTNFAYHKASVGYAIGLDMKTSVDWVAQKTSWLCNGILKAGAVLREAGGIVKISTTS